MASLFVACTAAAALIPIDKVVTAPGKVVATESTIVVQPLETAIVREIVVQEGQVVHKGDLLARLDPTFTTSDKTSLTVQVASLRAEVERLQAEAAGVDYQPVDARPASEVQDAIFAQRRAERAFRLENYKQKIDGLQARWPRRLATSGPTPTGCRSRPPSKASGRSWSSSAWGSQLNRLQATDQRLSMQAGCRHAQQTAKSAAGDLAAMRAEAAAYDQDWHAKVSQDLTEPAASWTRRRAT